MSAILQAEAERLRLDAARDRFDLTSSGPLPSAGAPALVGKTTTVKTYPTTAATFFALIPTGVLGAEIEGGAGTLAAGSGTFYALNLGTAIPPAGTYLLATFIGNRWVFRYDG